jgi:hypothetical protein
LPNFYNVAIKIAKVAARLTVLSFGRDKLGSSFSPPAWRGPDRAASALAAKHRKAGRII